MTSKPKHNIDSGPFKVRYEELTEDDLLQNRNDGTFINWVIRNRTFQFIPKQAITEKVLLHPIIKNEGYGETKVIHFLAKDVQFKAIPKDILTEELLATKDPLGESVYHLLVRNNKIHLLPKKLLTPKGLTLCSNSGWTPLHTIAQLTPHLIPKTIKLKDILLKDERGVTALHSWANSSWESGYGWQNIPKEFLTTKTLGIEDIFRRTPFTNIAKQFYPSSTKYKENKVVKKMLNQFNHVLAQTSSQQLKEATKTPDKYKGAIRLIKTELVKRKLLGEINKKEQSIEI